MIQQLDAAARALVIDLGAGSGRAMLAELAADRITLRELHRFDGYETEAGDGPAWDTGPLLAGIEASLVRAAPFAPASIGVDSWGLDFGLVDASGQVCAPVLHYRHPRSARGRARVELPDSEIRALSGGQVLDVLTLFQLAGEAADHPARLVAARHILPIAALASWHLTGRVAVERSLARTTGLHDPETDTWHPRLVAAAGVAPEMLPPIVEAGTELGPLRAGLPGAAALGPVVATVQHDTAAAVAGLPLERGDVFLVAGSWILVGWMLDDSVPDARALADGFGCEGGVGGRAFMVRSLPGLYLMRALRQAFGRRRGAAPDWQEIATAAAAAPPGPAVDLADPRLFDPEDIDKVLADMTNLQLEDLGGMARALHDGIAAAVAQTVPSIARLRRAPVTRIVAGGGGVQDTGLMAAISRTTGCEVLRGPVEASALGNALVQFVATGALANLAAGHALPIEEVQT